jgi:hypothetical protein
MERSDLVAGAQPVPVKVYDYYEPSKSNSNTRLFTESASSCNFVVVNAS